MILSGGIFYLLPTKEFFQSFCFVANIAGFSGIRRNYIFGFLLVLFALPVGKLSYMVQLQHLISSFQNVRINSQVVHFYWIVAPGCWIICLLSVWCVQKWDTEYSLLHEDGAIEGIHSSILLVADGDVKELFVIV